VSFWGAVKGFGRDLGKAWTDWYDQDAKPNIGLAYDMALVATSGFEQSAKDKVASDWKKIKEREQDRGFLGSVIGPGGIAPAAPVLQNLGTVTEVPGVAGVTRALDTPREWAGRAMTSATLVMGPGGLMNLPFGMPGDPLDADDWHKAWNTSRHMSPGQSMIASIGAANDSKDGSISMDDVIDYNKEQGDDPTKQSGWYRYTSGALDFGANFLDPSFGAGKLAKAGKLKYLTMPLKEHKLEEGRYLDSNRLQKVLDLSRTVKSSNELYRKAFSESTFGGSQANVLYRLRHDEDAQRLAIRGFLGDESAMLRLKEYDPGAADKILDAKTREDWADLKSREDLAPDHPRTLKAEERERLNVFDAQRDQAARDAYLDPDTLTLLRTTLVGQAAPRVGKVASARYAIQQKNPYDRPISFRLLHAASTDARIITHVNVHEEEGHIAIRRYLDRTTLDADVRNAFLDQYMAAPSPEIKARIAGEMEDTVIKKLADDNGIGEDQYKQILAAAQRGRAAARYKHVTTAQKFVSEQGAEEMRKAVAEHGDVSVSSFVDDEDNVVMTAQRLLTSQSADIVPLADIDHMKRVFNRHASKFQSVAAGGLADKYLWDVMDDVIGVWKVSTLLRGGWPVRQLSDETARQAFLLGGFKTMTYGARGVANAGRNMWDRGRAGIGYMRARNSGEETAQLDSIVRPSHATVQANAKLGLAGETAPVELGVEKFRSMEEAYANGKLTTDAYIKSLENLADEGILPKAEAGFLAARKDLGEVKFRKKLMDYSLSKIGYDRYTNGPWQTEVLDQALQRRIAVNPFTGDIDDLDLAKKQTPAASKVISRGDHGQFDEDNLYDFISEHRDLMAFRGTTFGIVPDASGGLRLEVYVPDDIRRSKSLRASMGIDFKAQKRTQSTQSFKVKAEGSKEVYEIEGALIDGVWQKNVGTNGYEGGGTANLVIGAVNTKVGRSASKTAFTEIRAADDMVSYKPAWERAANHQLGNDVVARRILVGETDDKIIAFLESDAAKGIRRDHPFFASNPGAWVTSIRAYVDHYIPDLTLQNGKNLRVEALAGRAKADDFIEAMGDVKVSLPDIHGEKIDHALGMGGALSEINKGVDYLMTLLGTLPSDVASRNPFFDRSYRNHMQMLIDASDIKKGRIDLAEVGRLQHIARTHALSDLKKWMYNSDSVTVLASKARYMSAFMGATQDAMSAWSRIMINDPSVAVTLNKLWNAPDKAGLIVDANGNQLQMVDGKEAWFAPTPDEQGNRVRLNPDEVEGVGQGRYITLKLPDAVSPKLFGKESTFLAVANKDSFNTFLNLNPGAGPLLAAPVNEIIMRNPTLVKDEHKFEQWVTKQILPFGPTADWTETIMSTSIKEAITAWRGEESDKFNSRTSAIMQTMLFEWARGGKQGDPPTWDQAASRAGNIGALRLAGALALPIQFQYKSPYQPYIDAYNLMKRQDPQNADMKFYERYGEEYFYLTSRVTKSLPGLPTSVKGQDFFEKNRKLIEKHPELLGLIMGEEGAGEFSKSVYEWGKRNSLTPGGDKLRRQRTPEEVKTDTEERLGWVKYTKFMDAYRADLLERGLKSDRQEGAEDLRETKRAFLDQNAADAPAWRDAFYTVDSQKYQKRIEGMVEIAKDETLRGRDDIQGLTDYLLLREQMKHQLTERAAQGGAKTLEAQSNADLADMWDDVKMDLLDRNLAFSNLYDRWLVHDKF
jgi:hypothetical protein